jgi:hypothetical protein
MDSCYFTLIFIQGLVSISFTAFVHCAAKRNTVIVLLVCLHGDMFFHNQQKATYMDKFNLDLSPLLVIS